MTVERENELFAMIEKLIVKQDNMQKHIVQIENKLSLLATNHLLEWLEELKGYAKALADRYNALDMLPDANYDELLKLEAELGVSDIDEIQAQIKVYKESMNSLVNAISKSDAKILASDMFASSNDNTQSEKIIQMLDELKSRVDEADKGIEQLGKGINVLDNNMEVVGRSVYQHIVQYLDGLEDRISNKQNTFDNSLSDLKATVDRLPKESAISRY